MGELRTVEESIEVERAALTEGIKAFQDYLEQQKAEEKREVTQLNMEQNELDAHEQQLVNAVEESDRDEDDENE